MSRVPTHCRVLYKIGHVFFRGILCVSGLWSDKSSVRNNREDLCRDKYTLYGLLTETLPDESYDYGWVVAV